MTSLTAAVGAGTAAYSFLIKSSMGCDINYVTGDPDCREKREAESQMMTSIWVGAAALGVGVASGTIALAFMHDKPQP